MIKKALALLASDKRGRKLLGYVIGIAVFFLLLPMIVLCGLFGWLPDGEAGRIVADALTEDTAWVAYIETGATETNEVKP